MKTVMKWGMYVILAIVLIVLVFVMYVQLTWQNSYAYELPEFEVIMTPEAIENGRYLVYGPAHCAACHTPKEKWPQLQAGEYVALTGGYGMKLPFGTLYTSNLTPDPETGIGNMSDAHIYRALRANVSSNNRTLFPIMDFHQMSDEDLNDIIAFLKVQEPVANENKPHEFNLVGKTVMKLLLGPVDWGMDAPVNSPPAVYSLERGEYVANNVAACMACHTERDLKDGSYIGPKFAGGFTMDSTTEPDKFFITPNITPDAATGIMAEWDEEIFINRFREGGRVYADSPMPWESYARMSDDDLRSVYLYLSSLEPVESETGRIYRDK